MRSLFCHGLVVFTFTASVLIPQKAFSSPLFDEGSWRAHSFYTRTSWAGLSSGIGGLQSDIQKAKDKNLHLEPSDVSYSGGYLRANIENKQVTVKVSPKIVREAIKVVEGTDKLVFQVSVDSTQVGSNNYIDEALQDTEIGKRLLDGDLGFASIVSGSIPLPNPRPRYPSKEALRLLNTDAEYRKLPTKWESFPESYPQIYLYFNPKAPGLVSTQFKPQVFFRSPSGLPLEVDEKVQKLGERPYLPLMKDVKERPLAYRAISPELEQAASITATLGLLEAACKKPGSCKHLSSQTSSIKNSLTWNNGEPLENKTNEQQQGEIDTWWQEITRNESDLQKEWKRRSFPVFQPSDTPEAWGAAYDALQRVIQRSSVSTGPDEEEKQTEELKDLVTKQFFNHTVPNDSLLQAALALVLAWNGQKTDAEQSLNQAIQLSAKRPGDRIEVLQMVRDMRDYKNISLGSSIENRIKSMLNQARIAAYKEVDEYLQNCMKYSDNFNKLKQNCPDKELREWEAEANRAGLTQDTSYTSTRDIAWLHGRFAYLVGVQLKEKVRQSDRLRFLSFYAQTAQREHRSQLCKLEGDFKKSLGIASHSSCSTNRHPLITTQENTETQRRTDAQSHSLTSMSPCPPVPLSSESESPRFQIESASPYLRVFLYIVFVIYLRISRTKMDEKRRKLEELLKQETCSLIKK